MSFYKCDYNETTSTEYVWSRVSDEEMKQLIDKKACYLSDQDTKALQSIWSTTNASVASVSALSATTCGVLMLFTGLPILFFLISLGVLTTSGVSETIRRVSATKLNQRQAEELSEIETEIGEASLPVPLLFLEMAEEYFQNNVNQSEDDRIMRMMRAYVYGHRYTIRRSDGESSRKLFDWLEVYPEEIEDILATAGEKIAELDKYDIEKYPEEFDILKELVDDTFIRIEQKRQLDERLELENKQREEAWRREDEEIEQSQKEIDEQVALKKYGDKLREEQTLSQQIEQQKRYERETLIEGIKSLKKTEGTC